ncbi:MAG: GNAT family N-acetyltransferase [Defluviitaleaceae bacterium]|nr:GNAT family N-acetyltransferase [Defluviitaleaceae bacterium]
MKIRVATIKDVDQLALLFVEQFDTQAKIEPYFMQSGTQSKQFIEDTITNETSQIFVAEDADKIIGFVSIYERKTNDLINSIVPHKYAYLMEIIVTKQQQGRGIATQLMNTVNQWALDRKLDYIELNVYANNPAVDFYIKSGYVETNKIMVYRL